MKIRLIDIPEDGKAFVWSRETAELNAVLADLIEDRPYRAEFFIKPINHRDFELTGTIKTGLPEQCSRCGLDFDFKVDESYQEILIPYQPGDRTAKYAKVNHVSEAEQSGPGVQEYATDDTFDMGEYLHEQVAIALPFNPAPPENENGDCSLCLVKVRGRTFNYDEQMPVEKPQNPFAVLKGLKLQ